MALSSAGLDFRMTAGGPWSEDASTARWKRVLGGPRSENAAWPRSGTARASAVKAALKTARAWMWGLTINSGQDVRFGGDETA